MEKFIGFYWTLPVPWAGFTDLPKDADQAAQKSKTIRYQRDRIRAWVGQQGGDLIQEVVFMEVEPDRGSSFIIPAVDRLIKDCQELKATLVMVNFAEAYGWRSHSRLFDHLAHLEPCITLSPESISIDGKLFNPIEHFRNWRTLQDARAATKPERKKLLQTAAKDLAKSNDSFADLALAMNESGLRTMTGKPWTEESIRKFLRDL